MSPIRQDTAVPEKKEKGRKKKGKGTRSSGHDGKPEELESYFPVRPHDLKLKLMRLSETLQNLENTVTKQMLVRNPGFKYVPYSGEEDSQVFLRRGASSFTVGPVLQLISVIISNVTDSSWKNLEIYGEISLTTPDINNYNMFYVYKSDPNDDKNIFYAYQSDPNDGDFVSYIYDELLLNRPSIAPIMEGEGGTLNFTIFRKDDCDPIFDEHCDVEKNSIEDPVGGTSTLVLNGTDKYRDYRASIVFTRIQFAVIAYVSFYLTFTNPEPLGTTNVYGTIRVNNSLCYERSGFEPIEMMYCKQHNFALFRRVFAIPAHSPLEIQVRLLRDGCFAVYDTFEVYPPCLVPSESHNMLFDCMDERCLFGATVEWSLHEGVFGVPSPVLNVEFDPANVPDISQVIYPDKAVTSNNNSPLVEIFSVVVCGRDSSTPAPTAIRGTIIVRDQHGSGYIFNSNVNGVDKLSYEQQYKTLSLAWPPRWIVEKDFLMRLELEDVEGISVCNASQFWHGYAHDLWLRDGRSCDFIDGENGYFAVMNFSIFKNGKRAKVSAKWRGGSFLVYGTIVATYSNYEYYSTYHKKYFQSIIFSKTENDCVKLRKDYQIPLLKSHVAAPENCAGLIVRCELWICHSSEDSSMFKKIEYALEFEAYTSAWKYLENIAVKVEWF